jgi:hypothetical protein
MLSNQLALPCVAAISRARFSQPVLRAYCPTIVFGSAMAVKRKQRESGSVLQIIA